jgi:hypothetical protein
MCLSVVCYMLSGRGLCDELITRPEQSDYGASLCVIKKPRVGGGHSPWWDAVPEKIIIIIIIICKTQVMPDTVSFFLGLLYIV